MKKIQSIAQLLENISDPSALPAAVDLSGWNSDHQVFDRLIIEVQPKVIIEVGTWKGRSARHMAESSEKLTELCEVSGTDVPKNTTIYCVDTWLGGLDHLLSNKPEDDLLRDQVGASGLYRQFLKNFADDKSLARRIYPVQTTSLIGARLLSYHRIKADLIYIDGSHEYDDVYSDLCAYSKLLAPGGVMFGDDFRGFPGVFTAVLRFAYEFGKKLEEVDGNFWILR